MSSLLDKYTQYILNPYPSRYWKSLRFILHWVSLPIKVLSIGSLGFYQIISKKITIVNRRNVPLGVPKLDIKRRYVKAVLNSLPVFKSNELNLYTTRVPYDKSPDGTNHNIDHQCSRHSTYHFIMDKLGLLNFKIEKATWMHMNGKWLTRGYKWNAIDQQIAYNDNAVSGDMLCGLNLAMLTAKDNTMLREKYENLILGIIENDYALLDSSTVPLKLKSPIAMWQPGLETVGAQALTILASLKIADKICGSVEAKKEYDKLFWKYGYGLLSLFPTAYIDSQRGYFNDHNCMINLYVLSKLSRNSFERWIWRKAMWYTWSLSKHWYNSYFTGLLKECYPDMVDRRYIAQCQAYLYENFPRYYGASDIATITTNTNPIEFNKLAEDEFSPDIPQNTTWKNLQDSDRIRIGLGFLASAVMIENDYNPKALIGDK